MRLWNRINLSRRLVLLILTFSVSILILSYILMPKLLLLWRTSKYKLLKNRNLETKFDFDIVNYDGAWTDFNLPEIRCIPVNITNSAGRLRFRHICPSFDLKNAGRVRLINDVETREIQAFNALWHYAEKHPKLLLLDIGANVGMVSIPLLNMIPTARVIAVEPVLDNVRRLTKGVIMNQVQDRLLILRHAIYNESGQRVSMISYSGFLTWSRMEAPAVYMPPNRYKDKFENNVTTITFEDLLPLVKSYERRCVIKIDVEGAECQAVGKIGSFLSQVNVPLIVMETDKVAHVDKDCVVTAFGILEKHGYIPFSDNDYYRRKPLDWRKFKSWTHVNTIWGKQKRNK